MSKIEIIEMKDSILRFKIEGQIQSALYYWEKDFLDVHSEQGNFRIPIANAKKRSKTQHQEGSLQAPMPGKIIKVLVQEKQSVKKGEVLLIMEAMKMEHKITAPKEGQLNKIFYKEGDRVSQGEDLISME